MFEYAGVREVFSPPEWNSNLFDDDEVLDDALELGMAPIRGLGDYANLGNSDAYRIDQIDPATRMTRNERRQFCAMNQKLFAELYVQDAIVDFEEPEFPDNLGEIIRNNQRKQAEARLTALRAKWVPLIDKFIVDIRTLLQSKTEIDWAYYNKVLETINAAQAKADECGYDIDVGLKLEKALEYHYGNLQRLRKLEEEKQRRQWYLGKLRTDAKIYAKTSVA